MKPELEFWDAKHDQYAAADWIDQPSLFAQWAIKFFPPRGRILELGAAHGQDARFFAGKGYHVIATDFSDKALEFQKVKNESAGLARSIKTMNLDLMKPLPFADGEFEVVYAHLALHYFDRGTTERIFADIHRVLKPGGIFAMLVNSTSDPEAAAGEEIEKNYRRLGEGNTKRFFDIGKVQVFAEEFEILVLDNKGEAYKDRKAGVSNLIRLVARR